MSLLRDLGQGLLQLLYPGVCWGCGTAWPGGSSAFCLSCRAALTTDPYPTCPRCAGTVGPFALVADGCGGCRDCSFRFERVIRLGPYDGLLRELILRLKQPHGDGLAELVGELWAEHALNELRGLGADVVVPVPLHWWRRWRRGHNQSEALARALAARLGLPYRPSWLRRVRHTPLQTLQTPAARRDNVRGAFRAGRAALLRGKAVLLIDDVLTTGSTAGEAAKALRDGGAARVVVAVLARAQG